MDEFETAVISTGETEIFLRWFGSGPPILLLHGFPQTHLMWRSVAPIAALTKLTLGFLARLSQR